MDERLRPLRTVVPVTLLLGVGVGVVVVKPVVTVSG